MKVIYLLGFARSGTTLLGNMLGELEGFLHAGELRYIWPRALRSEVRCGCKQSLIECPFWSEVLSRTLARFPELGPVESTAPDRLALGRARALQKEAYSEMSWRARLLPGRGARTRAYLRLTEGLLQSAAAVGGANVLIDSSKLASSAAQLVRMPSISPYFLHVIRDPRGAVLSRQKRRAAKNGDKYQLGSATTTADSLRWMGRNLVAERIAMRAGPERHQVLRYEDFIAHPAATLNRIVDWIGEGARRVPLVDEKTAILGPNHTVCGNKNRFETGEVPLHLDEAWRHALRQRDYWLVTLLTGAGLTRYGYAWRRGAGHAVGR